MNNKSKKILSEISAGELFDKISILEIKLEKIKDVESQKEINKEYDVLKKAQNFNVEITKKLKYFLIVKEDTKINILGGQFIIKVFLLKVTKILLVQYNKFKLKNQQILH